MDELGALPEAGNCGRSPNAGPTLGLSSVATIMETSVTE